MSIIITLLPLIENNEAKTNAPHGYRVIGMFRTEEEVRAKEAELRTKSETDLR